MPGEADRRTVGRLSAYRHVNLAVFGFSLESEISQVQSEIRTSVSLIRGVRPGNDLIGLADGLVVEALSAVDNGERAVKNSRNIGF